MIRIRAYLRHSWPEYVGGMCGSACTRLLFPHESGLTMAVLASGLGFFGGIFGTVFHAGYLCTKDWRRSPTRRGGGHE